MRVLSVLVLVLAAMSAPACGGSNGAPDGGSGDGGPTDASADSPFVDDGVADAGPSCTVFSWDPEGGELARFPEPGLLVDDPSSGTGFRLSFDATRYAETVGMAAGYVPVFTEDLPRLDGFGLNAQAFFRFGRAFDPAQLPDGDATAAPTAGLGMAVMEPGAPYLQSVLVTTTDHDSTLLLAPMRPLPEQGWAIAYVTRALTAAAGGCLEPSQAFTDLLATPDARTAQAVTTLQDLGVITSAGDLVALTVFPTMTATDDSRAVAADVATRDYVFDAPPVCTTETEFIRCEASFTATDYRDADHVLVRNPGESIVRHASYVIPMTIWLPKTGTPPYPTLVYGHGLGGGRSQGARLAQFAAPVGFATVAIPAVQHGAHPSVPAGADTSTLNTALRFFTIGDLTTRALEPLELRDNWRQSTWDKLQLTRLLSASPDVDGDGTPDVDGSTLMYLGVSLGGVMGPELLALTDAYGAGVLVVPGGRVSAIISESSTFGSLVTLLRPRGVSEGDTFRFFPVLQTLLDAGDAATFGPHVLSDRFAADRVPSVLLGVVLDDDTVPNVANYTLARAMGVDIVLPLLRAEPGMTVGPAAPSSGNLAGGTATAGLLQFDVVRDAPGATAHMATHSNVGDSEQGAEAWFHFLNAHVTSGLAEIADPYAATGLAHE